MCHILMALVMCMPFFMALKILLDHQADKPRRILEANIRQVAMSIHLTKSMPGQQVTKTHLKLNSTNTQVLPAPTSAAAVLEHRSLYKI